MKWGFLCAVLICFPHPLIATIGGFAFTVALLAALVRVAVGCVGESQVRLAELLACVALIGTLSGLYLDQILEDVAGGDVGRAFAVTLVIVCACGLVGAGAAWGWSACRWLNAERTGERFLLLAYGWLLAFGLPAYLPFVTLAVVVMSAFFRGSSGRPLAHLLVPMLVTGALSALTIPGIRVELRIRRLRAAQERPPDTPPPTQPGSPSQQ